MVLAMFVTDQTDFGKASPDYATPSYLKDWKSWQTAFGTLVPTGLHRASTKEVIKTMTQVSKSLRDPLNI